MSSLGAPPVPFGANLEPVLRATCDRRLSRIDWFRTEWQRGGALTGYATWLDGDSREHAAVVKLPVAPNELVWLQRLQQADGLVPRLYRHGTQLADYDIAWIVMERIAHGPLNVDWGPAQFDLLADSAARFYAMASRFDVDQAPPARHWDTIFKRARDGLADKQLGPTQRWNQALKMASRRLPQWLKCWDQRNYQQWCHGDLHMANAMARHRPPGGPAVLLDLARIHAGHWIEDAVYLEHLYWGRRKQLHGRKPCSLIARRRKAHGMSTDDQWPQLASIQRALLAAATAAQAPIHGNRQHTEAVLEVLEEAVC